MTKPDERTRARALQCLHRRTGDTVDIDLLAAPSLAPISGLAALQSAAARKVPATIEVDLLPAPGSACGPGTGRSPFVLTRR